MKGFRRTAVVGVAVGGLCTALAVPGTPAQADANGVHTIATGFAGPLHVAVAPNGLVYVADAFAGQIDRVNPGTGAITTVVQGNGFTPGVEVLGQQVYFTESVEPESGDAPGTARLMRTTPDGEVTPVADLLQWELDHNPDGQPQGTGEDADSNPYSVLVLPGRVLVGDAAGNDIVEVRRNGAMRTLVRFPVSTDGDCASNTNNGVPNGGCDPVPTDMALGPDGFLYVSGLGAEVEGHIWKVNATTGQIVNHWGGFPPLTGIAVANNGTIYAASLFTGMIFRIAGSSMSAADVPGPAGLDWARGVLYAGTVDFEGGPGSLVTVGPAAFHPLS
ncbi:MAG: ScyD/ScyE family protein [Actinomycetota bacterium]|nr:ScyD/ScyE family protein [Actinomycetota bacterium]